MKPQASIWDIALIVIMLSTATYGAWSIVDYLLTADTRRARECSRMLHKTSNGTLVPITEDASIEIGACLLQFNQPLTGETP